jgi:hypothetical protein
MAINKNRSVWGFHGIPAILVGFFVLIAIAYVFILAIVITYRNGAQAPYDEAPIRDIKNVQRIADMESQRAFAFQSPKAEK